MLFIYLFTLITILLQNYEPEQPMYPLIDPSVCHLLYFRFILYNIKKQFAAGLPTSYSYHLPAQESILVI